MHKHLAEYNKTNLTIARVLRKTMTDAERKLWLHLRRNQLQIKFRRQFPISCYVLDFYCPQLKLNIELDGGQHYTDEGMQRDKERDMYLQAQGIDVLRIADNEILQNEDGVLQIIYMKVQELKCNKTPSQPSPKRGR